MGGFLGTGMKSARGFAMALALLSGTAALAGATEDYNAAYAALEQKNYVTAGQLFQKFAQNYPPDSRAGTAVYWWGETAYVQLDFTSAATIYMNGYQKYPQSPKAANMLLGAGLSLAKLGKTKEACTAFAMLSSQYPNATGLVTRLAAAEKSRLNCR